MTDIFYQRRGRAHDLSITGHAGYDEHGHDIVCAGISAITYTLLGFIENHVEDLQSRDISVESGSVFIICTGNETIDTAFDMALLGYEQIAAKYPNNVSVTYMPQLAADSREKTADF